MLRAGTNVSELTKGMKLVKTRKAWDKNTVLLLLCVSPNLNSHMVFLPANHRDAWRKLKRGCGVPGRVGEQHARTLGDLRNPDYMNWSDETNGEHELSNDWKVHLSVKHFSGEGKVVFHLNWLV